MKVLGWVLVGVAVLIALASLDPTVVGLSTTTPVLQAIALRGLLAVVAAGLGVVLLVAAVLARRTAGRGRRTLVLGVVALLVGVGHGGVLAERGVGDETALTGSAEEGTIDVLALNTLGTAAGRDAVAELVARTAPDVVALSETPADDAEQIAELSGLDFQVFTAFTGPSPVQATALLVATSLGEYEQTTAPATTFATVWASPVSGSGPELVAVHAVPPVPQNVPTWIDELERLTELCARVDGLVMAGDYNATLDHAPMRDAVCEDTGDGVGGRGTWPADRPGLIGTAIDHVLVDPATWHPVSAAVLDPPAGGDHRAVLVRLVAAS